MKKVKGIVLESTAKHLILLTGEGEYRRLPAQGKLYPLGAEVELAAPAPLPLKFPVLAAAAVLLLVLSLVLLWQTALARPAAYLALDINPSVLLFLDKNAAVIKTEFENNGGQAFGATLKLKGLSAVSALEIILQEAFSQGYLDGTKENVVFLTLAAPLDYRLNKDVLRQSAERQLLFLEIDSYLKINTTSPENARSARRHGVSLNAVLLAQDLAARGLLAPEGKINEVDQGKKPNTGQAGLSVGKLLEQVPPEHVFTEKEFIQGIVLDRQEVGPGLPWGLPEQAKGKGKPEHTPPKQEKKIEKPDQNLPGQTKKPQGPQADTPPARDKDTEPPGEEIRKKKP